MCFPVFWKQFDIRLRAWTLSKICTFTRNVNTRSCPLEAVRFSNLLTCILHNAKYCKHLEELRVRERLGLHRTLIECKDLVFGRIPALEIPDNFSSPHSDPVINSSMQRISAHNFYMISRELKSFLWVATLKWWIVILTLTAPLHDAGERQPIPLRYLKSKKNLLSDIFSFLIFVKSILGVLVRSQKVHMWHTCGNSTEKTYNR